MITKTIKARDPRKLTPINAGFSIGERRFTNAVVIPASSVIIYLIRNVYLNILF